MLLPLRWRIFYSICALCSVLGGFSLAVFSALKSLYVLSSIGVLGAIGGFALFSSIVFNRFKL